MTASHATTESHTCSSSSTEQGWELCRLRPTSPLRPSDYRWRLAHVLARQPRLPLRKYADAAVLRALRYLRALGRCRDEKDRQRLARRMPDLAAAHALYQDGPQERRWAVEARVLANEPAEVIADKHGLDAATVNTFEQVFFAERHVLRATDRITCSVVRIFDYVTEPGLDVIWKLLGYQYGPVVLDRLIPVTLGPAWHVAPEDVNGVIDEDVRFAMRVRVAIALRLPCVTPASQLAVLRAYVSLLERERAAKEAGHGRPSEDPTQTWRLWPLLKQAGESFEAGPGQPRHNGRLTRSGAEAEVCHNVGVAGREALLLPPGSGDRWPAGEPLRRQGPGGPPGRRRRRGGAQEA
jgi:hypothetical protein